MPAENFKDNNYGNSVPVDILIRQAVQLLEKKEFIKAINVCAYGIILCKKNNDEKGRHAMTAQAAHVAYIAGIYNMSEGNLDKVQKFFYECIVYSSKNQDHKLASTLLLKYFVRRN